MHYLVHMSRREQIKAEILKKLNGLRCVRVSRISKELHALLQELHITVIFK